MFCYNHVEKSASSVRQSSRNGTDSSLATGLAAGGSLAQPPVQFCLVASPSKTQQQRSWRVGDAAAWRRIRIGGWLTAALHY